MELKIWDGQRQIRYTGPKLTYVVGSGGFAIVKPAETVEDKLELTIDSFAGMEPRKMETSTKEKETSTKSPGYNRKNHPPNPGWMDSLRSFKEVARLE